MPARTLGTIAAAIQRHTDGEIPFGEIVEAINNANQEIHEKFEWPWTRAETYIEVQGTYTTGTISVADGSTAVTGAGTAWNTGWLYKRILIGNTDYPIAAVTGANTLTLVQPINQGQSYVNVNYAIFQDTYPLPADCEFGTILVVVNPIFRVRLYYIPTYTLERQNIWIPGFFTNYQFGFCDAGQDDATHANLIRMTPPPSAVGEYRMIYRRRPPDLSTLAQQTMLPRSFDSVLEKYAEYLARFNRKTPMPGWMEVKSEAYQLLQNMRRKVAGSMYDNFATYSGYPLTNAPSSSTYANGLFIGPTSP